MIDKKDITTKKIKALAKHHGVILQRGDTIGWADEGGKTTACIIGLLAIDEIHSTQVDSTRKREDVMEAAKKIRKDKFFLGLEFGLERWDSMALDMSANECVGTEFAAGYEAGKALEVCL